MAAVNATDTNPKVEAEEEEEEEEQEEEEEEEGFGPEDVSFDRLEVELDDNEEVSEDAEGLGEQEADEEEDEGEEEEGDAGDAAGAASAAADEQAVKTPAVTQEIQTEEAGPPRAAVAAAPGAGLSVPSTSAAAAGTGTAAAAGATAAAADGAGTDAMDLKQLEAQATKVAQDVQHAALEMSTKLTASFKSALGGLGTTEAPTLSKLAGGLASWWGSLDPPAQPKRDEQAERVSSSSKATSELQELFGLLPEENLVESFKCKLLQTYGCSHNSFTPAIQMAFQGTMYITDKHTCFSVEERNRKLPFKVPHAQIAKAERHRPSRKGDLSDILRLELQPGAAGSEPQQRLFLAFKDFDSGGALDSALALVEHLMSGS